MMCSDSDSEELVQSMRILPRNLSYSEESYLDRFSVSSRFVHNDWVEKEISERDRREKLMLVMDEQCSNSFIARNVDQCSGNVTENNVAKPGNNVMAMSDDGKDEKLESDEEGVFVNLLDDLDIEGRENDFPEPSKSYSSDEYRDSISSTEEGPLHVAPPVLIVSESCTDENEDAEVPTKFNIAKLNMDRPIAIKTTKHFFETLDNADLGSPEYEEEEFNFNRKELRKSSSLKSNKTPPGTPSRKKAVRFADAMGLDLESVRHILHLDAPPKIPAYATKDLKVENEQKDVGSRYLTACFSQPCACDTFLKRVLEQKVSLENAVIQGMTITGLIRVANVGFHKSVRVRYTTNKWATCYDVAASYVQNSCDGATDRFSFSIVTPPEFSVGSTLDFCIKFESNEQTFWDNNNGDNYTLTCYARTAVADSENAWVHFL